MTNRVTVSLRPDEKGYLGRECPNCERYFKITPGTGIQGPAPCHCPYCGHGADASHFHTRDQIEYARSVALRTFQNEIFKMLKKYEGPLGRQDGFIKLSITLRQGAPIPIRGYRESDLETEVTCNNCSLKYTIYGVFAYCPDCGEHNSLQTLNENLETVQKMLNIAAQQQDDLREHMVADALENAVSVFDGFGREVVRVRAAKAGTTDVAYSFQNLIGADRRLQNDFGFSLAALLPPEDWRQTVRSFQKRHLLAHAMGVVDDAYAKATNDPDGVVGRKISIQPSEVTDLLQSLRVLGAGLRKLMETP